MKIKTTTFFFLLACVCVLAQQRASEHRLAQSMQRKLDYLSENAKANPLDPGPTVMTEEEVNDYLASGKVKLPLGVEKVTLQGHAGIITALTHVDFDQIRAGQRTSNPLLNLFSGRHNVSVEADAAGAAGKGRVHVRIVAIDGLEVPHLALEIFVDRFLKPKYPNVGIDSEFDLPDKINTATVGYHKLTVVQK